MTLNSPEDYYNTIIDASTIRDIISRLEATKTKYSPVRVSVEFEGNPDISIPMWLVTDKDNTSKIIQSVLKPYRMEDRYWTVGSLEHIEAPIDSPYAAKFFGIFWKKAADELRKMGLPKWEDDPVEIELSRIKFNYF